MQIIAEQLVIVRGGRTIIDNLSFKAAGGEALLLTGANGTGKTTLLKALSGFLKPESGRLAVDGGDTEKSLAEQAHAVGHGNAVKSSFTVRENLQFWSDYGGGSAAQLSMALEKFALHDLAEFPAAYLSAGQKRRLGLARLLVAERPIWLLDEPTSSLDTGASRLVANAIDAHTAKGGIAVVATHLPLHLTSARELRLERRRLEA